MLFLDTSALVKRYIEEEGTRAVLALMEDDGEWAASALCLAEARITLCHLLEDADRAKRSTEALETDWERFFVVPVDDVCLGAAIEIGCGRGVRTLDAVHLAAATRLLRATFVTFDVRQRQAADALGLELAPE